MTREEAKGFLIDISYKLGNMSVEYLTEKDGEKMREAIELLEQAPCDELDFVQPHKKVSVNLEVCKMREATQEEHEGIDRYIDSIAEPCEDAISRILKKMWNCGGKHATSIDKVKMEQILRDELLLVKPQSCPDAIRRQAVLELVADYDLSMGQVVKGIHALPPVNPQPKTGHCKDCNWWKDSDGFYRRGAHAESQCPINRKEVFDGTGYCYMFEPQESGE